MTDKGNIISNKTQTEELMMFILRFCFTPPQRIQSTSKQGTFYFIDTFFQIIEAVCIRINLINLPKQAFILKTKS